MQTRTLSGTVQSGILVGHAPVKDARVTVFHTGDGGHVEVARTQTNSSGQFSVTVPEPGGGGIFYVRADILGGVQLVACMGTSIPETVLVNELTSVAASFSLAQFIQTDQVIGSSFALGIAAAMNDNLASTRTGDVSPVLLAAPNGDQTISTRVLRSLANVLVACVQEPNHAPELLYRLATFPENNNRIPATSFQAFANVARYPWQNAAKLYDSTLVSTKYAPALTAAPTAWTLAVKVNNSGGANVPFGGPATLVFDRNGYAWVTNNFVQGAPVSSTGAIVLKPNGQPSDGQNGTPRSPLTGGGLLGTAYGVDIDSTGKIWFGNFGWGGFNPSPDGMGSVSRFSANGQPISPAAGDHAGGAVRVQAAVVDQKDNVWLASFGNDSVVVLLGGDIKSSARYQGSTGSGPFGIAIASDGAAWVTNSGGLGGETESSVTKFVLENNAIKYVFNRPIGKALKGVAVDSAGNAWVASGGDNKVYMLDRNGNVRGGFGGGGINGPWGVAVDGNDNIWVANFGPMPPQSNTTPPPNNIYTTSALTCLAGVNQAGRSFGDVLCPGSGYTLPSGGAPVLLPNGDPLYGPGRPPSYSPLMRQTNCVIDQAGNVWAINNWKPDFAADALHNPGGDGIVIFVGMAKPPPRN